MLKVFTYSFKRSLKQALTGLVMIVVAVSELLGSTPARATSGKVILLTSVDTVEMARSTPSILFWVKKKLYGLNAMLEQDFRNHFKGSGMEVEVFHYADLSLLYRILHSPDYAGVYWVSHGSEGAKNSQVASGGIFDYQTFDMSSLLRDVHPDLKLLSIVSCHSTGVLDQLRGQGMLAQNNPGLSFLSFENVVNAETGLHEVLDQGDRYLKTYTPPGPARVSRCADRRTGVYVLVHRKCQRSGPALFMKANERIAEVFPSCEPGEVQSMSAFIDLTAEDLANLDQGLFDPSVLEITFGTGAQPVDRVMMAPAPYFGEISIQHPGMFENDFAWSLLEMGQGKSLGVNHRIYSYQGKSIPTASIGSYLPYTCR